MGKISQYDLCFSCRNIYPHNENGISRFTLGEQLSGSSSLPYDDKTFNTMILSVLLANGVCEDCIITVTEYVQRGS
jgi:hypothetical protein